MPPTSSKTPKLRERAVLEEDRMLMNLSAYIGVATWLPGLLLAAVAACSPGPGRSRSDDTGAGDANRATVDRGSVIERGRYLAIIGGCDDCHSPKVFTETGPVPDTTRLLSGHRAEARLPAVPAKLLAPNAWGALVSPELTAWVGMWGVSFAANLTPDATGLGGWTPDAFIQTMRTGKHWGTGRAILPPMPWYSIGKLTDEDLRALFAYLQTLKPVSNSVPLPLPPGVGRR